MLLTGGPLASGPPVLRILETENFTQVASLSLGTDFAAASQPYDLAYLGGDGVAFLCTDAAFLRRRVFIFRSPTIASPP